jgi:hypothetical protein
MSKAEYERLDALVQEVLEEGAAKPTTKKRSARN